MTPRQTLKALASAGTAQNRKVYGRHGVSEKMFGVSYAELGKLEKKIGPDHELARELWSSGVHDARILATMVAEPEKMTSGEIDRWVRDLENYVAADAFSKLVANSRFAAAKMKKFIRSKREWTGRTGWLVCAHLANHDDALDDDTCSALLQDIEGSITGAKNRTKDAMNSALIAIGLRSARMENEAVAAARRIGPLDVDHGETSCKTPDAIAYIAKAKARRKKR